MSMMVQDAHKTNKVIVSIFAVQVGLFLWGIFARKDESIPSQQWVAWTLLFLVTIVLGFISLSMASNRQKISKVTILILAINAAAVAVALYIHFNPNLG
jgi:drug/metabolite transporter (DMT)-like permease